MLLRWQFSSSKITILLFIVRKKKFCVWYRVVGLELVVVAHGSKSDNFDKSMCTKAKNPFGVLPLVTQKLDWRALLCIERRKLHKKCQQFFPFEIQVQSFVFCIEILTSRNVNVDRLTREYFYSTKPTKSNDFFFSICTIWSTLDICWSPSKKLKVKKVDLILLEYKNVTFLIFTLFKNPQKSLI